MGSQQSHSQANDDEEDDNPQFTQITIQPKIV